MANTNLQNQLGLGLAVKNANKPKEEYDYRYTTPTWEKWLAVSIKPPEEQTIDIGGWPKSLQATPDIPTNTITNRSFASFSPATPSSTAGWIEKMWDIAGITPKKKKNIWETAWQITDTPIVAPIEPPKTEVQPFWDATKGQDVQFRQSYRQALELPIKTETPTTTSPLGLSGAELEAYNQLTPQEQKTYQALATQWVKAQTDYLAKSKAGMEFAKSQEEKRTEMEDNADAIADMNSQRNIEEATKQVANLKQNIGYLWTGGQPWVSSQKLDAVSNQVTLADRTLKNIIEAERLSARNRQIGQEKNSEIFTRQIKILQDDLDSKVNKTIQSALNEFTSAELEGKLDTIPEIEAFQQQLYAQLDWDLSSIMDTNIEARKFLIERYDKLAESQKAQMQAKEKADAEALKRKNTLNKEMSQALGYYVNENGEALTDRVTGMNIVVPPESDVTYDKDSGQMVILTKNRDGSVWVQIKQVAAWIAKAPQTTVIENPDWTKTTMQWNGSSWVPLQVVQTQPADYYSQFRITQNVGAKSPNSKDNWYNGGTPWIDFAMPENTDVKATVNGIVSFVWPKWDYGNQVVITDSQGNQHMYSHLNGANVQVGQQVSAGNSIGLSGNTGFSTGAHLDYRVKWANGKWEDPNMYLWQGSQVDQRAEAMALVQWLGGTEWERASFAKNIIDRANKKWLSLIEAKKELGYKSLDDKNFEETRKQQYNDTRKDYSERTWNAKSALTLLNEPQTAIGDVASVVWFLKTIDPASVARESEVEAVESARGIIDSLSNVFTKAKEGTKLTPTQRDQLKWAIQTIVTASDNRFYETVYEMKKEFDSRGLDATVYIPKTYIDKAQKQFGKAEEAKKKLGWFPLTDILSNLK